MAGFFKGLTPNKPKKQEGRLLQVSEQDELQIIALSERIVREASAKVNPAAEAETKTGMEPRYYLKLEIKAALRDFEKKHKIHLGSDEKYLKKNATGHPLVDYLNKALIDLVAPHFEGGSGPNKTRPDSYIRYTGGPEISQQIPKALEKALVGYRNGVSLERLHEVQLANAPKTTPPGRGV